MRRAFAKAALGKIADDGGALVHQPAEGDRARRLGVHVAQAWDHQRLADLVLDRRNRFGAEARRITFVLVDPERANYRIAHVLTDELPPEDIVDQQAGKHEEGRAGRVEKRADGAGEDVIEAWSPAVRPNMTESGNDTIGHDWLKVVGDAGEGIEADRPVEVGRS